MSICGFVQWAQGPEESRKAGSSGAGITDGCEPSLGLSSRKVHICWHGRHMRPAMGPSLSFSMSYSQREMKEEKMEETSVISQWLFFCSCRRGASRFGLIWQVFHKQQLDWRSQQGIQKYCRNTVVHDSPCRTSYSDAWKYHKVVTRKEDLFVHFNVRHSKLLIFPCCCQENDLKNCPILQYNPSYWKFNIFIL